MAKEPTKTATAEPAKKVVLPPVKFKQFEQVVLSHHAIIPHGHTLKDVMTPGYFINVVDRLRINSEIHFVQEYFAWGGTLLVTGKDGKAVSMHLTHSWDGPQVKETPSEWHKFSQTASGWNVILKATGAVVAEGLPTRSAAILRMAELDAAMNT